jgi:hypothetical protein
MHLTDFHKRLDNLKSTTAFAYVLSDAGAFSSAMAESKLKLKFPGKVADFFVALSGLRTSNPEFLILPLQSLRIEQGLIHFATFDSLHDICFDISALNTAGEWDIIHKATGSIITHTIASFWSNKIWKWLEEGRPVWTDQWWDQPSQRDGA